ncbi:energy transducer TonB [Luteithermobacter gelatinilyticus]|uniref:energy transducer TonB n=1 Tax=Luteithermobacter gelatinilyticus TaxID=2582913 RepID=UPI001105D9EC|nr:energy transducer TonB [Luteithermobacter gelatinilyticus]|tara:strand:- start:3718 stop:4323 length:606 start_codon:yes stop_codon:yes gene_type:complete
MIARYTVSFAFAALITFMLFFAMQLLIATGKKALTGTGEKIRVEIAEVRKAQEVEQKIRKPDKPEEVEAPPETPEIQMDTNLSNVNTGIEIGNAPVSAEVQVAGTGGFAASDGDYLPIVKVAPVYPRRAAERGIEGYVILEFTVTKHGTVTDIRVVESTSSLFNRAAIKAAEKFKYKPKVVDGEPVDVAGVLHKITFELEK